VQTEKRRLEMENINLWIITVMIAISGIALHLYYQGKVLAKPENSRKIGEQMWKASIAWIVTIICLFVAFLIINWPLAIG
jgi:uncharacterized membrane protein YidH (DUF202 family)